MITHVCKLLDKCAQGPSGRSRFRHTHATPATLPISTTYQAADTIYIRRWLRPLLQKSRENGQLQCTAAAATIKGSLTLVDTVALDWPMILVEQISCLPHCFACVAAEVANSTNQASLDLASVLWPDIPAGDRRSHTVPPLPLVAQAAGRPLGGRTCNTLLLEM
jgi:hypothetical protein